jgi:hypothetical protein
MFKDRHDIFTHVYGMHRKTAPHRKEDEIVGLEIMVANHGPNYRKT